MTTMTTTTIAIALAFGVAPEPVPQGAERTGRAAGAAGTTSYEDMQASGATARYGPAWRAASAYNALFDANDVTRVEGRIVGIGSFRPAVFVRGGAAGSAAGNVAGNVAGTAGKSAAREAPRGGGEAAGEDGSRLGLRLRVATDAGRLHVVHAGPSGFLARHGASFAYGDRVTVEGSVARTGGREVLITRSIRTQDGAFELRDRRGRPVWTMPARSARTDRTGSGPPEREDSELDPSVDFDDDRYDPGFGGDWWGPGPYPDPYDGYDFGDDWWDPRRRSIGAPGSSTAAPGPPTGAPGPPRS